MLRTLNSLLNLRKITKFLCLGALTFVADSNLAAPKKKCQLSVEQYSAANQLKLKRAVIKALKSYDHLALLKLAQSPEHNLSFLNQVIQEELARYSSQILAKGISPKQLLVGAGASTAALSATLRSKMSETERKRMLIVEEGDVAVNTFYEKDFDLNSPTVRANLDANFIPHGIIQHSDLFSGRVPHSDETAFVLLTNLWFSKIPVAFNSRVVKISSSESGLQIHLEQQNKEGTAQLSYEGIQELGVGTGPGQQNLRHIARGTEEAKLRKAMMEAKPDEALAQSGLYSTLSFLNAARISQNTKTKLPHEMVIVGHAHSAFTVAEALLKLWKQSPERFEEKPKITIVGASMRNSKEFLEEVVSTSPSYTKRNVFLERYKKLLPEFFDDKSVQGVEGRVRNLSLDDSMASFSLSVSPQGRGNSLKLKTPLVVLATGHDEVWEELLDDSLKWEEMDAWGAALSPKQVQSGRDKSSSKNKASKFSRVLKVTDHPGRVWTYGLANPLLKNFTDIESKEGSLTGASKSINSWSPTVEALGRSWTDELSVEFREPELSLAPGSWLLNGL